MEQGRNPFLQQCSICQHSFSERLFGVCIFVLIRRNIDRQSNPLLDDMRNQHMHDENNVHRKIKIYNKHEQNQECLQCFLLMNEYIYIYIYIKNYIYKGTTALVKWKQGSEQDSWNALFVIIGRQDKWMGSLPEARPSGEENMEGIIDDR